MTGTAVQFTLPVPPSVNQMYAQPKGRAGRRYKTTTYKHWEAACEQKIAQQYDGPTIKLPVLVVAQIERSSDKADVDNRLKALLDRMVKQRVLEDDSLVTAIAVAWGPPASALCRVAIYAAVPLTFDFRPSPNAATGGWFLAASQDEEPN